MPIVKSLITQKSAYLNHSIFTSGERFTDGAFVDLVTNSNTGKLELLFWGKGKCYVAPQVKHGGRTYRPLELDPTVSRAIRWPVNVCDYSSTRDLFGRLLGVISLHTNLSDHQARLTAFFVLSTWSADSLSMFPTLAIFGPYISESVQLLRLLSCLCRRSLVMGNVTQGSLVSLPLSLSPTLLLDQPGLTSSMRNFLSCSNHQGLSFAKAGRVLNVCCPKVLSLGMTALPDLLSATTIRLFLQAPDSPIKVLDDGTMQQIAADFQARLLCYRLTNCHKLSNYSDVAVRNLEFNTRDLATNLAACVVDNPELAEEVFYLLQPQSDAARGSGEAEFDAAVIECLLARLHAQSSSRVIVKNISESVNTILKARGEIIEYSPEDVGRRLRILGFNTKHGSSGNFVLLCREVSVLIHRLARLFEVPSLMNVVQDCPDCNTQQIVEKKPPMNDVNDVKAKSTRRNP